MALIEISPNELRKETLATLKEADGLLNGPNQPAVSDRAALLQAKAQCLNTLVLLQGQSNKKKQ